jgi:hypothetical protein
MIHSFTVTFGAKYLTGMVTSVPPSKIFSLIKNNILQKLQKSFRKFKFLRYVTFHIGHVTCNFINILFISTGIFDDKLRPQILLVGTTAYPPLSQLYFNNFL